MQGTIAADGDYLSPPSRADTTWQIRGLANLDGDPGGNTDLLWHHQSADGYLHAWLMDGTVSVGESYLNPSQFTDLSWQIRALADFDANGSTDLLWHRATTGDLYIWLMNGLSVMGGGYTQPPQVGPGQWQIRGSGDFNQDRQPDLLWHHQATGELYIWFMSGTTCTGGAYLPQVTDTNWQVRMIADFNSDGVRDVLWHHRTIGDLYVWFLDANRNVTSGAYLTPGCFADQRWQIVPQ